jgi:SAM-dependent methyltransferase
LASRGSSTGGGSSRRSDSGSGSTASGSRLRRAAAEPASFRDPASRVFYADDGAVLRALTGEALEEFRRVAATDFFTRAVHDGRIVETELLEPAPADLEGHPAALRHERIPFVSYPYEWSFSMLREAALLQLDLLLESLDEDVILKDGSSYNVQWRGATPVFVDVGSLEPVRTGEAWAGYRQFCMLNLYPLLLQAYKGVSFNAWLRGSLEGISPADLRRVFSLRDILRRGVLTHVRLHSSLEQRLGSTDRNVRAELREAGFGTALIRSNVKRLQRLVRGLEPRSSTSAWTRYGPTTTYEEADAERKAEFVRTATSTGRHRLAWDLGAGHGRYTRIAAQHAAYTVALDADPAVVDRLFRSLAAEGDRSILPLVADVADPPPALGWRGRERVPLERRGRPDLVLCLALVHHLALSANVPLAELVGWLRSLDATLVVEFVTADDPMAKRLLERKRAGLHADYDRETFERLIGEAFAIERTEELASGARVLYLCRPGA